MLALPLSPDQPLLLHGDSFDILDDLPAACIDVCITDPPSSIAFMNKAWDRFTGYKPRTPRGAEVHERLTGLFDRGSVGFVVFMVDIWTKVARVLKPGAFVVAWALPKTADLQALAMRCVGWTVADSLLHCFGSGMAKGLNISKAIDDMHGAEREVMVERRGRGLPGKHGDADGCYGHGSDRSITAPATEDARRWDGWNTQLAPGWEQYLIADTGRTGTYADQVLTHGTGALHVDACRIPRGDADRASALVPQPDFAAGGNTYGMATGEGRNGQTFVLPPGGSWPRNVVLTHAAECGPGACADGCPAGELDRQTGITASTSKQRNNSAFGGTTSGQYGEHDDTGGASRFFTNLGYFPKASDRRAGIREDIVNKHPTHKNPDLTEWLTRLFAATSEQTGGLPAVVLDPFSGSFTGAVAAIRTRVRFVGITLDAADVEVGRSRVAAAVGDPVAAAEANALAPTGAQLGLL